jgi:hypothetical protein
LGGFGRCRRLSNPAADLGNGMHPGQINTLQIRKYGTPRMNVVVHQAGNDGMTAEIRQPRLRAGQSADGGTGSDGEKLIAAGGERLLNVESRINGNDFPIEENLVGNHRSLLLSEQAPYRRE